MSHATPGVHSPADRGRKILILKPSSLGDVIQALPVLRLLKLHQPRNRIYWWIDADLLPLLTGDPDLDGLIAFHRHRWVSPRHWPEVWQSLQDLRAHRFDWVIDLQSLARSGIVAWLANPQLAIGLDDPREGAPAFYDVAVRRPSFHTHAVDWYLAVLHHLGIPVHSRFCWIPERTPAAQAIRKQWPATGHPWIALQAGARWDNKRWPPEAFAQLVSELGCALPEARFALLGSTSDRCLTRQVAQALPERTLDLAGLTSLSEMIEWIRRCDLFVSNDTGPMHAAAALGKPVVAIFGPTEPRRTGPYGQIETALQNRSLACVPCLRNACHHHPPLECLASLSPRQVAQVVLRRLASDVPPQNHLRHTA